MPSFIVHGLIPILLLLAFRLAPLRVALWMLPFTWLPDLDYFVGVHRATTSNLFLLLPFIAAFIGWRQTRPRWATYAGVAGFYVASHLLMDLFAGGIVPFWPLWNQTFFFNFRVLVNTETNEPSPQTDVGSAPGAPEVAPVFEWISPFETAMLALTVAVALSLIGYRYWKTRHGRTYELEEVDT